METVPTPTYSAGGGLEAVYVSVTGKQQLPLAALVGVA